MYGLSTQDSSYQREAAGRLHLPFALLSDDALALTNALRLPTFRVGPMVLLKRLTLIIRNGTVEHASYPVFPPDRSAGDVARWLAARPTAPEVGRGIDCRTTRCNGLTGSVPRDR